MRTKSVSINEYIIADPNICHGKPTFKGTRIMVWQILEMLASGENFKEILENYPSLTEKHIKAALNLASEKIGKEKYVSFIQTA
ncbi:hypothetical protein A3D00_04380 [Candidatus Woesebacteria bacterium RIFCSPHIGHO2_02_FULL_38_9]|uniref:Antitoxin n=1 Tax=Candidatus Woesebacteria bacterium RIFCSPHIGHO2_01_FULL_39_28 TaxID=1802496 RepID=A0A1F7YN51_9BACT|nr:MAG: hypothetical protein A2627_00605 [Candidatus Woesebacteria bacterium RIFCSPHIGHO2_01_FULL_39_28]OGM31353.1 MAG: hypothetical protein A3D00_04380 [Candidatus Woesebacteria bacterium RIFCSPHIGHO2_02_FULL_38_9]OGM56688.1 MAG: hypothetical protein A3A50_05015 [Candidatus Woesebacteria bacterium RIFCSPLOWO2_01_FULL_38_20]